MPGSPWPRRERSLVRLWITQSVEWGGLCKKGILVLDDEQLFNVAHQLLLLKQAAGAGVLTATSFLLLGVAGSDLLLLLFELLRTLGWISRLLWLNHRLVHPHAVLLLQLFMVVLAEELDLVAAEDLAVAVLGVVVLAALRGLQLGAERLGRAGLRAVKAWR